MPAKELDAEQRADAARLKAIFKAWQAQERGAGRPAAQDAVAEKLGFGQSALSQYLNGLIPLNPPALRKFCTLLGVKGSQISPRIAADAREEAKAWLAIEPAAFDYKPTTVKPRAAAKRKKTI